MKYQPFEVIAIDHYATGSEFALEAKPHDSGTAQGITLEIKTDQEYIYITKAQCMEFFGLVDAPVAIDQDLIDEVTSINKAAKAYADTNNDPRDGNFVSKSKGESHWAG